MPTTIMPLHPGIHIKKSVLPSDLTITNAAKILGVGRPALSNLLNGKASLSAEMALRIEKAFGAKTGHLLKMQAAYDQAKMLEREPEIAVGMYSGNLLNITAMQIEAWSNRLNSRAELAVLLRKLVNSTGSKLTKVDFPAYEHSQREGWDGIVEAEVGTPWIPKGISGWEFGCNEEPQPKAEKDYASRVKSVTLSQRQVTTFVFVTPKNWSGKKEWVTSKLGKHEWKDVRAYDASDLEQCLEQSLPAQAWLAEHLPLGSNDILSLDRCWNRWAEVTDPKLSKVLFHKFVQSRGPALAEWLSKPPERPFTLVGDSTDEALAFLACVFEGTALAKLGASDRVIALKSAGALSKAVNASANFIAIVASGDAENESAGIHRRQHTIVVTRRSAIEGDPDVTLDILDDESFETALTEMGVQTDRIERLKSESGRSLTVLRRRLAKMPAIKRPPWAADADAAKRLIPLLLVGTWSSALDSDQDVLTEIGAGTREETEKTVAELMVREQSPFWSVGVFRGVVSKVDALYAVHPFVTRCDLDRFFRVARVVLSETDPALDLPEESRWAASLYRKTRKYSDALRETLCETLVLLSVHGNSLFGETLGLDVEGAVNRVIHDLLTPLDSVNWQSQQHDLPRYAEAAPNVFLSVLEDDLRSHDPKVYALMNPVKSGMFGSCPRTGLLWALEVLAWNPQWLSRVVLVLAKLSKRKIDDNWANKPENSLISIFRCWMPQTAATIEQRTAALELLAKRNPDVGWRVCVDQFDLRSTVAFSSHRPRWRNDASGVGRPVTSRERFTMARKALDLALAWPTHDEHTLGDLVERLTAMSTEDQQKIWAAITTWAKSNPDDAQKAALREGIRRNTMTRRSIKRGIQQKLCDTAKTVYDLLAPDDIVLRYQWLFANEWIELSADELADDDFDFHKREERVSNLRQTALRQIWDDAGYSGIVRICSLGQACFAIGSQLVTAVLDEQQALAFIYSLVSDQNQELRPKLDRCLSGFLARVEPTARQQLLATIIERLSDEEEAGAIKILRLLQLAPFDAETWIFVDRLTSEERKKYWKRVFPYWNCHTPAELNRLVDELLNADRPRAAFAILMDFKEIESERLIHLLDRVARSPSETGSESKQSMHYLSEALEELSRRSDVPREELARLEFTYIQVLRHSEHGIPYLERELCKSPDLFIQVLALAYKRKDGSEDPVELRLEKSHDAGAIAAAAHALLTDLKRIPGTNEDGEIDAERLRKWLVQSRALTREHARQEIGDIVIGQLFARSPIGADEIWPCEPIREVLEELGTAEIARGMCIGAYNSRGVVCREEGGRQERQLADKYRSWSGSLINQYPFVAKTLADIASTYDRDAVREDTEFRVRQRLTY
jgi:addiction module HigA family antidote